MTRPLSYLALSLLLLGTAAQAQENNQPPTGFTALFNGKDLTGWHGLAHFDPRKLAAMTPEERAKKQEVDLKDLEQHWKVENGELINDGKGVYATTDKEFGDIELWIDYKTVPKADSGIYLRGSPQVQIWDHTQDAPKTPGRNPEKGSGGLFNNSIGVVSKDPLVLADKPFGEWNRFRIVQVGSRTSVWLNDKLVVDNAIMENFWDRTKPLFAKGPIQLQTHGGEIRWRNIFVREIPTEEGNKILASRTPEGFKPIFNGKDFTGWAGDLPNYEVVDGTIACIKGKGGTIYTNDEFGDFVARVEFKLPPGGNNGLALRYPGKGAPHLDGLCELQVLDSEDAKYAKLDARQYHGSVYGMIAATRGFLRPTGEWNFEEVTVKGSTIKVEVNGNVILEGDVSKVTDFMGGKPHPGKDLKQGHFGFAGHHDPVQFRNVEIKPLPSEPVVEKPAGDKPAAEKPAAEKPATEKPAAEKPAKDK